MMDSAVGMNTIIQALDTIFDPCLSNEHRVKAYEVIEKIKENKELSCQLGFRLLSSPGTTVVYRHFGLQLIEHVIKFSWGALSDSQRTEVQNVCMLIVEKHMLNADIESASVKDAAARCLVELAKREWPQAWVSFFADCSRISCFGAVQYQVALMTLQRLIEDVAVFQEMPSGSRRRELHSCLIDAIPEIVALAKVPLDRQLSGSMDSNSMKAVSEVSLQLLATVFEWAPPIKLRALDLSSLSAAISGMLRHSFPTGASAALCLSQLANRKGKVEERKMSLVLLQEPMLQNTISALHSTAQRADDASFDEFKALLLTLGGLTAQFLFVNELIADSSQIFTVLHALLPYLDHPSVTARQHVILCLGSVVAKCGQKELVSLEELILEMIKKVPKVLERRNLTLQDAGPVGKFACLEFDSDEALFDAFARCRNSALDLYRKCAKLKPFDTLSFMQSWLNDIFSDTTLDPCRLEATEKFISGTLVTLRTTQEFRSQLEKVKLSLDCMKQCIISGFSRAEDSVPLCNLLLSIVSTWVSAFPSHSEVEDILRSILWPIISEMREEESGDVGDLKRHACNVLLRIALDNPAMLLPLFDEISVMLKQTNRYTLQCLLLESLVVLSNSLDYTRRLQFLAEVFSRSKEFLGGLLATGVLNDPSLLLAHIGLTSPAPQSDASDTKEHDISIDRRRQLALNARVLNVLLRRINFDPPLKGSSPGQRGIDCAVFSLLEPMLDSLFALARCLNGLYTQECVSKIHMTYDPSVLDIPDADKYQFISLVGIKSAHEREHAKATNLYRVQRFLEEVFESVYAVISNIVSKMPLIFLQLPQAERYLLLGACAFLGSLMDVRMKQFVRLPFRSLCIVDYQDDSRLQSVLPVVVLCIRCIFQRLSDNWKRISLSEDQEAPAVAKQGDQSQELAEIYFAELTRTMTRDFVLALVTGILKTSPLREENAERCASTDKEANGSVEPETFRGDMCMDSDPGDCKEGEESLTALGEQLLRGEESYASVVSVAFEALCWRDTQMIGKLSSLCKATLSQALVERHLREEKDAVYLLHCALSSLQLHGEHEHAVGGLLHLSLFCYESLRPKFANLKHVLLQVPGVNQAKVDQFDQKIVQQTSTTQLPEKQKRDIFRRIVQPIIGENVGEKFKRCSSFGKLPPLIQKRRLRALVENANRNGPTGEECIRNLFHQS